MRGQVVYDYALGPFRISWAQIDYIRFVISGMNLPGIRLEAGYPEAEGGFPGS